MKKTTEITEMKRLTESTEKKRISVSSAVNRFSHWNFGINLSFVIGNLTFNRTGGRGDRAVWGLVFWFFSFLVFPSFLISGCAGRDDAAFARRVITQLIQGRYAARKLIAWNDLNALETDIGSAYRALSGKKEKENYERGFIDGFKRGFRQEKADKDAFTDWRVFSREDGLTMVAARAQKGKIVLLVGIRRERGRRQVSQLKLLQVFDQDKFEDYEQEMGR